MTAVGPPEASAPKAEWREWARSTRSRTDPVAHSETVVAGLLAWAPLLRSRATLIYLPLPDEVDLRALLTAGLEGDFFSTRTPDRGGDLTVHRLGGPLEVHRLGFLQSHASAPGIEISSLDVLLLPGLAFDLWGTRLGRGAGYFDRLLTDTASSAQLVGVTVARLVVDHLPSEPHDVPVGYLATEQGVVETAG